MNILFTCAGRRNYLINFFKNVMGEEGKIVAADMDITAPAMAASDRAIVVPDVYAKDYVEIILDICKKENINALISLNDLELPILAPERPRFDAIGVILLVSNETVIETCNDKFKTISFCERIGIRTPRTFISIKDTIKALERKELGFPLIVKPRWGSASIGIEFPENIDELKISYNLARAKIKRSILFEISKDNEDAAIIIQEKISGVEYGLDILNDLFGKTVQVYVKEKLAMRAGETDKAVLRDKPELEELGYNIGNELGHIGNLDCDIFEKNNELILLEMNPRFGGGYPFSHMSGANFPAAILAWIEQRSFDFSSFKREYNQIFSKYDTLIKVSNQ
jgi:carbamoyl-phosphate synthase large subunit